AQDQPAQSHDDQALPAVKCVAPQSPHDAGDADGQAAGRRRHKGPALALAVEDRHHNGQEHHGRLHIEDPAQNKSDCRAVHGTSAPPYRRMSRMSWSPFMVVTTITESPTWIRS